jgi:serine/threonine protein kinase
MLVFANNREPGDGAQPTRFGRYTVVRELGKGGMAQVFEGRHDELGSRVALKVMQPGLAAQPIAAARFLREAKAASQISHPNVAKVFDIGVENGLPFIVMEFLEGSNLSTLLSEKGPLSLTGIVDVFLPVISAVATAHAAGVIHRDLKPANLMITRRPPLAVHPVVLDFGISKVANEELEGTFTGSESLLGTVQYMAPELTKGAKFASRASDQYTLGIMLYECATGQRPFNGGSHYELMHAIVTAPVVPPSRLRRTLPREFDAIVDRAMHRDPAKRFPSMEALGSALLSFADRTAWALWENEFTGLADDRNLWAGIDEGTLNDTPHAGDRARPLAARHTRPAHHARRNGWLFPLLAVYAVTVTILLAHRGLEKDAAAVDASLPSIGATRKAVDPPSPTQRPDEIAPTYLVTHGIDQTATAPRPTISLEREPLATVSRPAVPLSSSRSNTQSTPSPSLSGFPRPSSRVTRETSTVPPPRAAAPDPAVVVGTNGAPIVD